MTRVAEAFYVNRLSPRKYAIVATWQRWVARGAAAHVPDALLAVGSAAAEVKFTDAALPLQ